MKIGIIAKLKHGDLLEAMIRRGWNQNQLGKFLGLSPSRVGELINMKWVPPHFSEEMEAKLIELTGKTSEQLFPEAIRTEEFRQTQKVMVVFREADPVALVGSGIRALPMPEFRGGKDELVGIILHAIDGLSSREKAVFWPTVEGETEMEIAKELNLSNQRISQIRTRVFKKVREKVLKATNRKGIYIG